jgi:hypothetical protein
MKVPLKIFFFMWFLHRKRVLTKDNLIKRIWTVNETCCFYDNKESRQHIFFECPFAKIVWRIIYDIWVSSTKNITNIYRNWLKGIPKNELVHIRVVMPSLTMLGLSLWTKFLSCQVYDIIKISLEFLVYMQTLHKLQLIQCYVQICRPAKFRILLRSCWFLVFLLSIEWETFDNGMGSLDAPPSWFHLRKTTLTGSILISIKMLSRCIMYEVWCLLATLIPTAELPCEIVMLSCFTLPLPWRLVPNIMVPNISRSKYVHISYTGDVCIFFQKVLYVYSFFGIRSGSGLTTGKPFSCSELITGSSVG